MIEPVRKQRTSVIVLLFLLIEFQPPWVIGQDFYQEGLAYNQAGEWQKALETWYQGYRLTAEGSQDCDFRLGIAFIQLVTEKNLYQYYEIASKMYLTGFSGDTTVDSPDELLNEMERISPILPDETYQEWQSIYQKDSSFLCKKIFEFWKKKDPTPSTEYNERLIEHWERIAHARNKYNKRNNTVYGTDDRGLIFVRFGKPDRTRFGALGSNRSALKRYTDVIINSAYGLGRGSATQGAEKSFLVEHIERYNTLPDYEIWLYDSFDSDFPVFFLFGNREGTGAFGLRHSVEEFIPRQAFLATSTMLTRGVIPGVVLQSVYYSEMINTHPFFEERYYDLEKIWERFQSRGKNALDGTNRSLSIKRREFEAVDKTEPVQRFAPTEQSNFSEIISPVDLIVEPFRFLDGNHSPKLAIVTFSYPRIKMEFLNSDRALDQKILVAHTLIVNGNDKEELQRSTIRVPGEFENLSTFFIDHNENQVDFLVYAEAFSSLTVASDSTTNGEKEPSKHVIGVGKKLIPALTPLSSSGATIELSDLIIGIKRSDKEKFGLPFPVVPSKRIAQTDLLKIYLEIYNLFLDQEGLAHINIDATAAKLKGNSKSREESVTLSFDFESLNRTTRETFEINISKLTPGDYELSVDVTDNVSQQKKQRVVRFEIY